MKHRMTLDYTVAVGDLAPYFEGLSVAKALASKCSSCGQVAFPARTLCGSCRGNDLKWTQLAGTARIMFRTDGGGHAFALVRFDGTNTMSTVALINPQSVSETGTLAAPPGETSGLWLALTDNGEGIDDEG